MGSESSAESRPLNSRLSLRKLLWIGFGGVLLILLTASGLGIVVLSHYNRAFERIFHENYDTVSFCEEMKESLEGLNAEAQHLLWEGSATPKWTIDKLQKQFDENIVRQQHNSTLLGEQDKSDAIALSWQQYRAEYQQFTDAAVKDRQAFYRDVLLPHFTELRGRVQQIIGMNVPSMVTADNEVRKRMNDVRNTMLILAAAGFTVAVLFVIAIGRAMLRPLLALTRSAQQIADGNLELRVNIPTHDEVGQLAAAFNVMAERLRIARQRDLDRLVRTEQTTQMAIDSLPDAVVVFGSSGEIELTNRAAIELFGLQPNSTSKPPGWLLSLSEAVLRTGEPHLSQGYKSAIQKFLNGEERFYLPRAVPLRSEDGRTVGVTVISADVTELKHADEAKSDLVSTVSHELRTPLTSIRMAVHILDEQSFGAPLVPQQVELLRTACDNSDRLHRILENLLNISRIESGRAPLKLEPVKAADIVSNAIAPLKAAFDEKGVGLQTDVVGDPTVLADLSCVGHVLTNLLTNALRFSPRDSLVSVSCAVEDREVAFSVSDSGPGLAAEHLPRLFEKFYRVSTPSHPAGAGLGLAIAKEIVNAHGGQISVRSQSSAGALFVFTLHSAADAIATHPAVATE